MPAAYVRPPRCTLVNLTSGESIECLSNPTDLTERLGVNWNRLVIPGMSHQQLQYQSTANRQIPNVEFHLDRRFAAEQPGDFNILGFRSFLAALTVPSAGADGVATGAPPRVLFTWPNFLTIESVVQGIDFAFRHFGVRGEVLVYTASVSFEEILDARVTSQALRGGTA